MQNYEKNKGNRVFPLICKLYELGKTNLDFTGYYSPEKG